MRRYVVTRFVVALPSLLIASLVVFTLPRLIPGDVVSLMLEEKQYAKDLAELRAKLGLDRPLHVQYVEWVGRVVQGDLGESLWTRRPVLTEVGQRLPGDAGARGRGYAVRRRDRRPRRASSPRPARTRCATMPPGARPSSGCRSPASGWRPSSLSSRRSGGAGARSRASPSSARPRSAHLAQFLVPGLILGLAAAAALMRLIRGHAPRSAPSGLRPDGLGQGPPRARGGPKAQPPQRRHPGA